MTLLFEMEGQVEFDFDPEALAREVLAAGLLAESFPYEAEISLTITGDEEIRHLNLEHRGKDAATDVLSFPMLEFPSAGDFSFLKEERDCFNPDTGEVMLGDIVISEPHVKKQAAEYGHSIKREYSFLLVHSLLHLLGYDHESEEEELAMFSRQEQILAGLHITR